MQSMSKRIIFTFDDASLAQLERVKERLSHESLAESVRDGVQLLDILSAQYVKGYTEIVLRNPKTDKEREIIVPSFEKLN